MCLVRYDMLVSNALLIKTFVILMCEMLCWFANGEHEHLIIEFYKHKKTILNFKIAIILFESIICLIPIVIT